jgi:hypothetical protein
MSKRNKHYIPEENTEDSKYFHNPNEDKVILLTSTSKLDLNYFTRLERLGKELEDY